MCCAAGPRSSRASTSSTGRPRACAVNIRTYDGTERHGNSIFIFEVANLCIAHLGHLPYAHAAAAQEIGRVDVVLVPSTDPTLISMAWSRCCMR
jgi:L-ascorbate metabolism protein UlaG (beta-lactamase superfamily)